MKTTLLRKVRERIISIDYSRDIFLIKYLNSDCHITEVSMILKFCDSSCFYMIGDLDYVLYSMFGRESLFMRILMFWHKRTVKKRAILQAKKKKVEYKF